MACLLLLCLLTPFAGAEVYTLSDGRDVILSVGGSFAYSRDTEGNIRCWGDNQFGQLGRGHSSQSLKVLNFKTKSTALDISQLLVLVLLKTVLTTCYL